MHKSTGIMYLTLYTSKGGGRGSASSLAIPHTRLQALHSSDVFSLIATSVRRPTGACIIIAQRWENALLPLGTGMSVCW